MAMLAEPRQKKRYNLTPRGKALYEDDTRFGTKMLEKMGWSKGKGLGAKEDGSKDFVRVRMRNTNEGLGYEDRDDHWTQHEQDFSGLLKTLNGDSESNSKSADDGNVSEDDMPTTGFGYPTKPKQNVEKLTTKFSGESLEEKSKRSKARVHYKKFTKGKDLSQYSEKDLANIFGKKVVDGQQVNGIFEQFTAIKVEPNENEPTENANDKEKEVNSNFSGVQIISTGVSVNDYFKQKMEAFRNKQKQNAEIPKAKESNIENSLNGEVCFEERKIEKSKRKKRVHKDDEPEVSNLVDEIPRKKKKSKETEKENLEIVNNIDEMQNQEFAEVEKIEDNEIQKKKKSKKDKKMDVPEKTQLVSVELENTGTDEPIIKKKKNKSKKKESKQDTPIIEESKDSIAIGSDHQNESVLVPADQEAIISKKSKKRKSVQESSDSTTLTPNGTQDTNKSRVNSQNVPNPTAKPHKKSKKDVSGTAEEIANQSITLDELIAKCNSYNVFTISSFCAEKFRKIMLESFAGATLSHIPGYSYNVGELKLDVQVLPKDEERIIELWNCKINKYQSANPKAIFHKYVKNVSTARGKKRKAPRFYVKTLKRKSAFQAI